MLDRAGGARALEPSDDLLGRALRLGGMGRGRFVRHLGIVLGLGLGLRIVLVLGLELGYRLGFGLELGMG